MSLTRKHFKQVADIIKGARGLAALTDGEYAKGVIRTCRIIENGLADYFSQENPYFQYGTFMEACGRPEDEDARLSSVPACIEAIQLVSQGDYDRVIDLPNGRKMAAAEVVKGLHLDAFIEQEED